MMRATPLTGLLDGLGISAAALEARGLRPFAEAEELVVAEVGEEGAREHLLVPAAAAAWRRMKAAAHAGGIPLHIVSAFRSVERQAQIVRRKLDAGQRLEDILCVSAPPGYSEHHTGRAVDVGVAGSPPLQLEFAATPAYAWLSEHAAAFGFVLSYPPDNRYGYQYEPWHWCYRAPPAGAE